MKAKLKFFSSPLIIIGLFFLLNPVISLFDILPDFIGYLCIYVALSELSKLDERIASASSKLLYLSLLSFINLVAFIATLGDNSNTIMMLSFSLSIAEVILIVVFLTDFFGGIDYALQRFGDGSLLNTQTGTRAFTSFFLIAKVIMAFIPELSAILELRAYYDVDNSVILMDIVSYKPYVILVMCLVTLALGFYWFFDISHYFKAIRRDALFMESAGERYSEVFLSDTSRRSLLCLKTACCIISVGFLFYLEFTVDGIHLLPTFIGTLLIACGIKYISPVAGTKTSIFKYALPAAVFQCATELFSSSFIDFGVYSMNQVPVWQLITALLLCAAYAVSTMLFLRRYMLEINAIAIKLGLDDSAVYFKRIIYVYYVFVLAFSVSLVLPVLQETMFAFKLISIIAFVSLAVRRQSQILEAYEENT